MVIVLGKALKEYVARYGKRINRKEIIRELNLYLNGQETAGALPQSPLTLRYDHALRMALIWQDGKWYVTNIWRTEKTKGGCV